MIIDKATSPERFRLCYDLLRKHCLNEINVFLLNPEIEAEGDFQLFRGDMKELLQKEEVTENFVYMRQEYFILKPFDFDFLLPVYTQTVAENAGELKAHGVERFCYSFKSGAPQVMNRKTYLETMFQTEDIESAYFNLNPPQSLKNAHYTVIRLDKELCCSNKAKIGMTNFATCSNDRAFDSLKDWIDKNLLTIEAK